MLHPLPSEWREHWLYLGRSDRLHRIDLVQWDDEDRITGQGSTLCGRIGKVQMPGVMGRLGAPRCKLCCKWVGIPEGDGAPNNAGMGPC